MSLDMCITANKHVHALKSWYEVRNGWNFIGIDISAQQQNGGIENCVLSKMLWYGFCNHSKAPNHCSGTIKTTLRMCGKARLTFGNCNVQDYVLAKLNGKEIGRANPYCCNGAKAPTSPYQSKTIIFDFKDGDILELTDTGVSIIVLDELNIISCSTC